jgi:hypothetical protein
MQPHPDCDSLQTDGISESPLAPARPDRIEPVAGQGTDGGILDERVPSATVCDGEVERFVFLRANMNSESTTFPSEVQSLRGQFQAWRETRKQGEHIPQSLWEAAAKLAGACGVSRVSRALGVGYYPLKERVPDGGQTSRSANEAAAFIELPPPTATMARSDYVVELEDGRGAKMTLHLAPGSGSEVLALAQAFWRRQP